ncbi:MAG: hypothetical protein J5781_05735 [Clostridia bacterium]|nr:hypothetical protein [Clostridia bacterium]
MYELIAVGVLPVMMAVVVLFALADILLLLAIVVESKKRKKRNCSCETKSENTEAEEEILTANNRFGDKEEPKDVAPAEEIKEEPVKEEPVEEVKEEPAPVEEKKEEQAPVEEPVEEKKEEPAPVEEPVEEKKEEPAPAPVEEVAAVEEKPEKKKVEKKPAKKEAKEKKEPAKKEAVKEEKPAEKPKKAPVEKKEEPKPVVAPAEEKKGTGVRGKIEICNSNIGGFHYILRANNGQLLYESKNFKSIASCRSAIDAFIEAVKIGMFTVRDDKFDRYKFILKSPTSNNIIYVGESFDNERSCLSNIESVRRFADASDIIDNTDADFKAHFSPYVISKDVKEKVKNNNGVVGKWAIEQEEGEKKNAPYVFLLYASNGQLLYESRDYSNYSSCKSGLMTFRKAIQEGEFIIDPDKAGRYKFILRNTSNNSLIEYIGQNYSTERACADGIDSIYRFALVSPVDKL